MYLVDEVVIWPAAQRIRIKCQVLGGVGILIYGRVIVNELLNILWDGYDSRSCPIVAGGGGFWEMGKPADYTHPATGPDLMVYTSNQSRSPCCSSAFSTGHSCIMIMMVVSLSLFIRMHNDD